MNVIERLFQYFEFKDIKPTRFEKEVGLSNGYLGKQYRRNADIGTGILIKIIDFCPELSIEWLLFGNGEMIKPPNILSSDGRFIESKCHHCEQMERLLKAKEETIEGYKETILSQKKTIIQLETRLAEFTEIDSDSQKRKAV
jgi:hypothetical protein